MRTAYTGIAACKGIFAAIGGQIQRASAHVQKISIARAKRDRDSFAEMRGCAPA